MVSFIVEIKSGFQHGIGYSGALQCLVTDGKISKAMINCLSFSLLYLVVIKCVLEDVSSLVESGILLSTLQGKGWVIKLSSINGIVQDWQGAPGSPGQKIIALVRAVNPRHIIYIMAGIYAFQAYMGQYQVIADTVLEKTGSKVAARPTDDGYAGMVWLLMFIILQVFDGVLPGALVGISPHFSNISRGAALIIAAYLNGFYAFDNNWKARGFSADERFHRLGAQALYMVGFGLPLAVGCAYAGVKYGFLGGFGCFLMCFPIHIIMAGQSGNFGMPDAMPLLCMTALQALGRMVCGHDAEDKAAVAAPVRRSTRRRSVRK